MSTIKISLAVAALLLLIACGDNSTSLPNQDSTISGTVMGLMPGTQISLQNNLANDTIINFNGPFTLNSEVAFDAVYNVTVSAQPSGKMCTVNNGSGAGVVANLSITYSNVPHTIS
jgi:hypothetical protein